MEINNLPNYLMNTEDDDTFIDETSYVSDPATEKSFLYFNEEGEKIEQGFKVVKDMERMTSGVWMMPDTRYLRISPTGEYYTVQFTKETLYDSLIKYLKSNNANRVKLEHEGKDIKGFVAVEHWIITDKDTKSPIYGLTLSDLGYNPDEIPVGTVMKTTYVEDEKFWNEEILTGNVKGYSIGGIFNMERFSKQNITSKVAELAKSLGVVSDSSLSVLLSDEAILTFDESIKLNGEVITDGEFNTIHGVSIVITEGKLVDFGIKQEFNEATPVPAVEPTTSTSPEATQVTEVVSEEAQPEVIQEASQESGQEEGQEEVKQESTPELNPSDAIIADLQNQLSLLQTKLAESEEKNVLLTKRLEKSPISTTNTKTTNKVTTQQGSNNGQESGKTIRVGGRTVSI